MIHLCSTCGCKDAESFDEDDDDWRDWGEGMTIPQMAKALSKMSWDEVDEETGYGDDLFDWFNKWDKKSQKERETYALRVLKESYGAESFEGESPMMKNITAIGVLALAIIIGKKMKR